MPPVSQPPPRTQSPEIVGIAGDLDALDLDCAARRIHHAAGLDQQPVAHGLDQPAMMRADRRLEHLVQIGLETARVPSSSAWLRRP
jgi:hypothetical protein